MNILMCSSKLFWKQVSVTATSVAINHPQTQVNLYILHDETVSQKDILWMKDVLSPYNISLVFILVDKDKYDLGQWANQKRWPLLVPARLFAFDFLPPDVERVLTLGADVIVNKPITAFYDMDLGNNYFAGGQDNGCVDYAKLLFQKVDIPVNDGYINVDILLHNIKKLREDFTYCTFKDKIVKRISNYNLIDQDMVNVEFHNHIAFVDEMMYSCIPGAVHYTREKELLEKTAVFHFASSAHKPWKYDYRKHLSVAVRGELWWKYAIKSGYTLGEYIYWKVINFFLVEPWNITYQLYRAFFHTNRTEYS